MSRFAFIVHPLEPKDAAKKYPLARYLPDFVIEAFLKRKRPMVLSHVTGIKSKTGATTEGIFIGCPLTPSMMLKLPLEFVYERILQCCELAKAEGIPIIGLGAFTAVVGDGGITIAKRSPIAVTTGNSYTVATALLGTIKACELVGIELGESTLAVVGATGSIGRACANVLAPKCNRTILVGRDLARTQAVADELPNATATTDFKELVHADVIISVTSSETEVIEPEILKPGAVVCDVARPRDVSVRVSKTRPDVLVIEGGVVSVPGDVDFGMTFGFPPKTAYACMSETMMLALEDRAESYTLGKDVSVEQINETIGWAEKHGFELAGFRSFERAVSDARIAEVRAAREAQRKLALC